MALGCCVPTEVYPLLPLPTTLSSFPGPHLMDSLGDSTAVFSDQSLLPPLFCQPQESYTPRTPCPLRRRSHKLAQQGRTLEVQLECGGWESRSITSDTSTNSLSNDTLIRLLISSVSVTWMIVFGCLSHEPRAISLGADIKTHPLSLPSPPLRVNRTQYTHSFTATWLSRSKELSLYPAHTPPAWAPAPPGAAFI